MSPSDRKTVSVILPARNEARGLESLLPRLRAQLPEAEIIVVNDASTDDTAAIAQQLGARVISHPYGMGNGAAIKTGARAATGDVLVFMDADGQHDPADIPRLLAKLETGYDMAVGARDDSSQAGRRRKVANRFYNKLASWMVGHRIPDLTSGLRVARAERFRQFLHLLPNGFSYPTTSTMAFFRAGFPVGYVPITAHARTEGGKSHIRYLRDGLRFLLIIFRIATLYSPLRLFFPASMALLASGITHYAYTYLTAGRFTNMSAMLFIAAIMVFLMGLVSEQITLLLYQHGERR